jgi:FMN phosphatase YigB (HAD superfamily)
LFHAIFEQTQANPVNSVMIDDNIERGLLPAHEFQMKTCWYKLSDEAMPSWVDFEIRSLSDLLAIF